MVVVRSRHVSAGLLCWRVVLVLLLRMKRQVQGHESSMSAAEGDEIRDYAVRDLHLSVAAINGTTAAMTNGSRPSRQAFKNKITESDECKHHFNKLE